MSADGKSVLRIPNSQVGWKVVNELDEERNEKSVRREKEKESTVKGNRVRNREERVRRKWVREIDTQRERERERERGKDISKRADEQTGKRASKQTSRQAEFGIVSLAARCCEAS